MKIDISTRAFVKAASQQRHGGWKINIGMEAIADTGKTIRIRDTLFLQMVDGLMKTTGIMERGQFLGGRKEDFGKMGNGFLQMWQI